MFARESITGNYEGSDKCFPLLSWAIRGCFTNSQRQTTYIQTHMHSHKYTCTQSVQTFKGTCMPAQIHICLWNRTTQVHICVIVYAHIGTQSHFTVMHIPHMLTHRHTSTYAHICMHPHKSQNKSVFSPWPILCSWLEWNIQICQWEWASQIEAVRQMCRETASAKSVIETLLPRGKGRSPMKLFIMRP